jgi:predicted enzyme related to lactoylglutathione lyase
VADAQAAVEAALALGAVVYAPATEVGDGIVTAVVRNPQGSLVGFIVNPHFQQG